MEKTTLGRSQARGMMRLGAVLVLMGLFTGLMVPHLANPRLGLSSHMEGVMSGLLLMVTGAIWPRLRLGAAAMRAACFSLIYGAFTNWANTLLAAYWGAGASMMPMASLGHRGSPVQETVIAIIAVTMALALLFGVCMTLWGLRGEG